MVYRLKYWTLILTLTAIVTLFLTIVNLTVFREENLVKIYEPTPKYNFKKIVGFSLKKQIELETSGISCNFSEIKNLSDIIKSYLTSENIFKNQEWLKVKNTEVYIYSVYYDERLGPFNFIRIIGMIKEYQNTSKLKNALFCKILTSNNTFQVTKATLRPIWYEKWDQNSTNTYFNPYLISCGLPIGLKPMSMSISSRNPCDLNEEEFKINLEAVEEKRRDFTVCVKPLNFEKDISKRLMQWIEMVRILGAEKFEFYVSKVERNVEDLLKWYKSKYPKEFNIVKFKEVENSKTQDFEKYIWQKRRYEILIYNDCLYKNLKTSKYIVPLDIDEIIVPRKSFTWKNVMEKLIDDIEDLENSHASYSFKNAYYLTKNHVNKSKDAFFFNVSKRTAYSALGESVKSFVNIQNTLTVFNHYALEVLRPGLGRSYHIPVKYGQVNHYKPNCSSVILPECEKYVSSPLRVDDPLIFKFRTIFHRNYIKSLRNLHKKY